MIDRSSVSTLLLRRYPFKQTGRKKLVKLLGNWIRSPMLWEGTYGLIYLLNPKNYIDARILRDGIYEHKLVTFFCSQFNSLGCDIFLDIGANIGVYSLAVMRNTDAGSILAFEPDPKNRNQLCASVFLNDADNLIQVCPEALSDVSGTRVLFAQRDRESLSTVQSSLEPIESHSVEVPVATLAFDDKYDWRDRKIAIKMDIEGHEAAALQGMRRLMQNNEIFLQIEIFDQHRDVVRKLLLEFGFSELPQLDVKYHDYYFTNIH